MAKVTGVMRRIQVSPTFKKKVNAQAAWYLKHRGTSFANTMTANLQNDVFSLASMPSIGRKYKSLNGHQYYSFPSKKKADIIYRYDDQTLYIADVVFYFAKK